MTSSSVVDIISRESMKNLSTQSIGEVTD